MKNRSVLTIVVVVVLTSEAGCARWQTHSEPTSVVEMYSDHRVKAEYAYVLDRNGNQILEKGAMEYPRPGKVWTGDGQPPYIRPHLGVNIIQVIESFPDGATKKTYSYYLDHAGNKVLQGVMLEYGDTHNILPYVIRSEYEKGKLVSGPSRGDLIF